MTSACSIKKVASLIDKLSLRRGQAVLLTLGAQGAIFFDGVSAHFCDAAKVEVVSTLGAGDAFASSFVYELLSGEAPAKALVAATKAASLVLGQVSGNYAGAMLKHACNCE
jgi:sugar/nucleoside kinase (ribokinase family)